MAKIMQLGKKAGLITLKTVDKQVLKKGNVLQQLLHHRAGNSPVNTTYCYMTS